MFRWDLSYDEVLEEEKKVLEKLKWRLCLWRRWGLWFPFIFFCLGLYYSLILRRYNEATWFSWVDLDFFFRLKRIRYGREKDIISYHGFFCFCLHYTVLDICKLVVDEIKITQKTNNILCKFCDNTYTQYVNVTHSFLCSYYFIFF